MLPTITKADLQHPSVPGEYAFRGMKIRVERKHLRAWGEAPDASFSTILCTRAGEDTAVRLALGSCSGPAPREAASGR